MINLFFLRPIKILMMATPFLSMILMLCALWGVIGKTTYTDINGLAAQNLFEQPKAKNFLVNETKSAEACVTVPKLPEATENNFDSESNRSKSVDEKIDWEHTV
jgi:hypothetical protein